MAEQISPSEQTAAMTDTAPVKDHEDPKTAAAETLAPPSSEAVVESAHGGSTDSSCNNAETSTVTSDGNRGHEKSLEYASELIDKGSAAVDESDFDEATDCFSRALEIRVTHYGELALECVDAYYKYGCALLTKAQEEADPLVTLPKKDDEPQRDLGSGASAMKCESGSRGKDQKDGDEESDDDDGDDDDVAEADEDESDLDQAWKMLDLARVILEKNSCETIEKVDVLSSLAEVALEREDVETSVSDYLKALSLLERIAESDSRHLAELNFRLCLCLEMASRAPEAIPYCQKAISICKSRVARLVEQMKGSEPNQESSSNAEAEITVLNTLSSELEKKLEDLQQAGLGPSPILSEMWAVISARARGIAENASSAMASGSQMVSGNVNGSFDGPMVAGAQANGSATVMDLGVVGRGVKRASATAVNADSVPVKMAAFSSSPPGGADGAA